MLSLRHLKKLLGWRGNVTIQLLRVDWVDSGDFITGHSECGVLENQGRKTKGVKVLMPYSTSPMSTQSTRIWLGGTIVMTRNGIRGVIPTYPLTSLPLLSATACCLGHLLRRS